MGRLGVGYRESLATLWLNDDASQRLKDRPRPLSATVRSRPH